MDERYVSPELFSERLLKLMDVNKKLAQFRYTNLNFYSLNRANSLFDLFRDAFIVLQ